MEITLQDANGQPMRFSPYRDIVHFLPQLLLELRNMLMSLTEAEWKAIDYNREALAGAYQDLTNFAATIAVDPEVKTVPEAIRKSGFLDRPAAVRNIILERLGKVCLGAFWAGVRSNVMVGETPAVFNSLIRAGQTLVATFKEHDTLQIVS